MADGEDAPADLADCSMVVGRAHASAHVLLANGCGCAGRHTSTGQAEVGGAALAGDGRSPPAHSSGTERLTCSNALARAGDGGVGVAGSQSAMDDGAAEQREASRRWRRRAVDGVGRARRARRNDALLASMVSRPGTTATEGPPIDMPPARHVHDVGEGAGRLRRLLHSGDPPLEKAGNQPAPALARKELIVLVLQEHSRPRNDADVQSPAADESRRRSRPASRSAWNAASADRRRDRLGGAGRRRADMLGFDRLLPADVHERTQSGCARRYGGLCPQAQPSGGRGRAGRQFAGARGGGIRRHHIGSATRRRPRKRAPMRMSTRVSTTRQVRIASPR